MCKTFLYIFLNCMILYACFLSVSVGFLVYVCSCVRACVCVRARVFVCVSVCVCVYLCALFCENFLLHAFEYYLCATDMCAYVSRTVRFCRWSPVRSTVRCQPLLDLTMVPGPWRWNGLLSCEGWPVCRPSGG